MKKIQAVLFDCDGVLVDSEFKLRTMMHQKLKEVATNYTLSFEEFFEKCRGVDDNQMKIILDSEGVSVPEKYYEECMTFLINEYHNFADKVDNVEEMLESLSDYPKVVCSNNWTSIYKKALERHDIVNHFEALLGQDVVEKGKPDPCVYLEGAKRVGIPIENCLAIEDTPGIGLQAAKSSKAGVVVGFTGSGASAKALKEHGADYTIDSLLELPELIKQLNL